MLTIEQFDSCVLKSDFSVVHYVLSITCLLYMWSRVIYAAETASNALLLGRDFFADLNLVPLSISLKCW